MNTERLQTLATALRDLDNKKQTFVMPNGKSADKFSFNYGTWGELLPDCGTTACALGLAGLMPEFRQEGLISEPVWYDTEDLPTAGRLEIRYRGNLYDGDPIGAAADFFEIPHGAAYDLFVRAGRRHGMPASDVTATQVADVIELMIARGPGYQLEETAVSLDGRDF